mmetsp:Transcript_11933/g.24122  ORF Transcript_11933/g.24122 Transcript_11933/m.24122 type:complete len:200 (+) Transcript_11933:1-600(+)
MLNVNLLARFTPCSVLLLIVLNLLIRKVLHVLVGPLQQPQPRPRLVPDNVLRVPRGRRHDVQESGRVGPPPRIGHGAGPHGLKLHAQLPVHPHHRRAPQVLRGVCYGAVGFLLRGFGHRGGRVPHARRGNLEALVLLVVVVRLNRVHVAVHVLVLVSFPVLAPLLAVFVLARTLSVWVPVPLSAQVRRPRKRKRLQRAD